jgi:hypothetical protein
MCDYSLAGIPNRLAVEGEQLVVYRFCTGALGLASTSDVPAKTGPPPRAPRTLWSVLPHPLTRPKMKAVTAVCIPPGARLRLQDIPQDVQVRLGLGATEEVTFVQQSADAYQYRDAVRFQNGRAILLQRLHSGQYVEVLSLASGDSQEEERRSIEEAYSRIFVG